MIEEQEITSEEMEIAAAAADVYPPGNGFQVAVDSNGHAYGNVYQVPRREGIKL